jgi:DNA repair protein SbcD/Mre11
MRFLHTADWHLGRLFHGVQLTSDQERVLDRLVELAEEARPDAVVISGDVYDRAVPPSQAVALLDDVLSRLVLGLGIPVVMVAGNHDSPERLEFGSRLLAAQGLHVTGWPSPTASPVTLVDAYGPVSFCPLPFAEPALVRYLLDEADVHDHEGALRRRAVRMLQEVPQGARTVAVGHAFVAGGEACDSERPLTVGTAAAVSPDVFASFDFAALGHLHRAQTLGSGRCSYSGSLLKYSFSEIGQQKGVDLVEMDERGACTVERVQLRPERDLRRIEGRLDDILGGRVPLGDRDDYLVVSLLDRTPLLDAMARLQRLLPNVLHLERPGLTSVGDLVGQGRPRPGLGLGALFDAFFCEVTGCKMSDEQVRLLAGVLERFERDDREASPEVSAAGPRSRAPARAEAAPGGTTAEYQGKSHEAGSGEAGSGMTGTGEAGTGEDAPDGDRDRLVTLMTLDASGSDDGRLFDPDSEGASGEGTA